MKIQKNASEIIATGDWSNSAGHISEVCKQLKLGTKSSYNFPWGVSTANVTNVYDPNGFGYTVYVTNYNDSMGAIINIDESSLKGSMLCVFQLQRRNSRIVS